MGAPGGAARKYARLLDDARVLTLLPLTLRCLSTQRHRLCAGKYTRDGYGTDSCLTQACPHISIYAAVCSWAMCCDTHTPNSDAGWVRLL